MGAQLCGPATVGLQIYRQQPHVVKNVLVTSALSYREVMDGMKNLNERNL